MKLIAILVSLVIAACSSTPTIDRVLVDADFSDAGLCSLGLDGKACSSTDCVSVIGTTTCTCDTTWACSTCPLELMQPGATCEPNTTCEYHAVHAGADARCTCSCSATGTWTCTNTAGSDCPTGT